MADRGSPAIPWRLDWFDLTPQTVAGWMAHVPQEVKPSTGSFLVGFGFLMLAALWTLLHPTPHTSKVTGLLCGVSLVLLGSAWLLHLLFQIASGQFKPLFSALPVTWSVEAPAHFQAVVATLLTLALLTLLMGALMLILACIPAGIAIVPRHQTHDEQANGRTGDAVAARADTAHPLGKSKPLQGLRQITPTRSFPAP